VLLPADITGFARLVRERGFSESEKTDDRAKLAGRIQLLHEVMAVGVHALAELTAVLGIDLAG
jgi:hypothetical protein